MTDVVLERQFAAPIEKVFDYISSPEKVLVWWGPESVTVRNADLNFGQVGPWTSEMHAKDGTIFKVSGEVTEVDPPHSVIFTWAWHDDTDVRGHESQVQIVLAKQGGGTNFTLIHRNLASDESAQSHTAGWTSSIGRLEAEF